jgi:glycosyltransferase involved in cell wall biosynthesis
MRILVLSFYYPPDIGPGSLRAKAIVDALIEKGLSDLKIDVITTMPNRYHSLDVSGLQHEDNSKVSINRVTLPKHKSGMFDQARAFISFSLTVRKLILKKNWDIVVATSSRLMTASLGAWVAKRTNSKLYLDIRDLFTDTMDNILAKKPLRILMPLFYVLEKWTFNSANKLNVVSAGFLDHFKRITPNLSPSVYTNGVDEIFLKKDFSTNRTKLKPLILYIGNIGDGQGLHKIIPKAANELKDIQFRLIGDGGARNLLINNHLFKLQNNIEVLNPVLRNELINEYQNADILFLHLNDYKAFHRVLPSKIFEYAATGKPILAGVSGHAAEFLGNQVKGVEVFNPCDVKSMQIGLQKLLNGPKIIDRTDFCLRYSRKKIMKKLAIDILSLS